MSETATVSTPAPSTATSAPASTPAAPATTAPATPAPAAPAPAFNVKEHATMKGAMDAFVKSKLTAAVEQQPAAPSATPAETVPLAEDAALQPAEKATSTEEHSAQVVDVAPDPELQIDPKVDRAVSPKVRAVLKMLTDPKTGLPVDGKVRKEIVDNYYIGKSVRDSGVPVAALKEYLAVAPTVDVLRNVSENASLHAKMLSDFKENPSVFAEQLYSTNQEAFQNLVSSVTDPQWLQTTFPKSFASIAKMGTRNYLDNAMSDAQRVGDADLEAAVGKLMEWGGLASPPQAQAAQQQAIDPREEKIQQLEEERAQFFTQQQNAFVQGAYGRAASVVSERITGLVEQAAADSPFNAKTQERIKNDIGNKLYNAVTRNEHIIRTLSGLVGNGPQNQAHLERVANYLQSQALALLPSVSREVIEEYSELVGPAVAQREQKVQKAMAQRPAVGSGGKPSAGTPVAFNPKQFGNTKEAFDAFVRHRLGG